MSARIQMVSAAGMLSLGLGLLLSGCGGINDAFVKATGNLYEEPAQGTKLIIEHQYDNPGGMLSEGKRDPVHICQVTIDGKNVFATTQNDNIPFGGKHEIHVNPGTHKFGVYWGAFLWVSCKDAGGMHGEVTVRDKDIHILLKNNAKAGLVGFMQESMKDYFGWEESGTIISEVDPNASPSANDEPSPLESKASAVDSDAIRQKLEQLKELHAKGLISQEDYERSQKQLVDQLVGGPGKP